MALGITWEEPLPPAVQAVIEVRTRESEAAPWRPWYPLPAENHDIPDFADEQGTGLYIERGRWFQLRLTVQGLNFGPLFPGLTVTYLDTRDGPPAPAVTRAKAAGAPALISRAEWGADESYRFDEEGTELWPPEYQTPEKIIIHHTATSNDMPDPAAMVRAIYYYHAVTRGWGDIGYNFLVDQQGRVYEGRYGGEEAYKLVIGGHAHRYNPGSIGIGILGNFQPGYGDAIPLPAAAEAAVRDIIAYRGNRYGIHPLESSYFIDDTFANVLGHRDVGAKYGPTSCPGDYAYARLDAIRDAAWSTMESLMPDLYFDELEAGAAVTQTITIDPIVSPLVTHITLIVDDEPAVTDTEAPLQVALDPTEYAPGEHTAAVIGYTDDGRAAGLERPFSIFLLPTATPTATATQTEPPATATPTPTQTMTPTQTPTPTQTMTPTSTSSVLPDHVQSVFLPNVIASGDDTRVSMPTRPPDAPTPTVPTTPTATTTATHPPGAPTATATPTHPPSAPTDTPPPTATATVPPTVPACKNLVINGDMEADGGWSLTVEDGYNRTVPAYYAAVPHRGARSVFVGMAPGTTAETARWSSARQQVTVPADGEASLSLWYRPESEATLGTDDRQYVFLYGEDGIELARLFDSVQDSEDWRYLQVDLAAYAGPPFGRIELYLGTKNDGAGGATRLYVDDVAVCAD